MIDFRDNEVRYCCAAAQMIAEEIKPIPIGVDVCSMKCACALSEAVAQEGYSPIVDGQVIRGM